MPEGLERFKMSMTGLIGKGNGEAGVGAEKLDALLRNPWVLVTGIFAFFALHALTSRVLTLGEIETMLYAKQFALPDFIRGDWYLNMDQPFRRPFHLLVSPLVKHLPLATATLVARGLAFLAVSAGLGLIFRRLRLGVGYALAILFLFMYWNQSLPPQGEWIIKMIESKVIAYAFLLLALHALMREHLYLTAFLAGLATLFHVLVGGWGSFALGLAVLTRRLGSGREGLIAVGIWTVTCSYVVVASLRVAMAAVPELTPDPTSIYIHFRNPHHLMPKSFERYQEWFWFWIIGGAMMVRAGTFWKDRPEARTLAHFALWTQLPYVLGLLAAQSKSTVPFLQYYPFRVGSCLFLLFGLTLCLPVVVRFLFPLKARLVALTVIAFVAFGDGWDRFSSGIEDLERFPGGAMVSKNRKKTKDLHKACEWLEENTARDARILTAVDQDAVNYLAERPVVVLFRQVPSGPEEIHEWYQRTLALNGGKKPAKIGYKASKEIASNFEKADEALYIELAERYDAPYLLIPPRDDLTLPLLFESRRWAVYDLRGVRGERARSDSREPARAESGEGF